MVSFELGLMILWFTHAVHTCNKQLLCVFASVSYFWRKWFNDLLLSLVLLFIWLLQLILFYWLVTKLPVTSRCIICPVMPNSLNFVCCVLIIVTFVFIVLSVLCLWQIWPLPVVYLGNLIFGLGGTKKLR